MKDNKYYVGEVDVVANISIPMTRKPIRRLDSNLQYDGYITVNGNVSHSYFYASIYLRETERRD